MSFYKHTILPATRNIILTSLLLTSILFYALYSYAPCNAETQAGAYKVREVFEKHHVYIRLLQIHILFTYKIGV